MAELEYGKAPVKPEFWFLEAGLYHTEDYKFEDVDKGYGFKYLRDNLLKVIFPKITIDVYCPSCKRETVFKPVDREIDWFNEKEGMVIKNWVNYAHFRCSRSQCGSNLFYVFYIIDGTITKIGQYPSIADLIKPGIQKYKAVIETNLIKDWQRAVGLRAHGIGAGSYVYLRRIIENMVNDAFELALKDKKINQQEYVKSRWPEKIKMLSEYLPNYLVENRKVYGVLSKGVHELSEEECSDYFDVMHTSIEIICEEKLAKFERDKKAETGAKALQKVYERIQEKSDRPTDSNKQKE
jgi:hypothetical protein